MKYLTIGLVLLFCFNFSVNAQTNSDLLQAKTYYKNKEYTKALPIFEQEYYVKPTDASINLWYGVCLAETNTNPRRAEECLLIAAKKNMPESYIYLGDIYLKEYRAEEATQYYDRYAKARPKEKATTLKHRYESLEKLEKLISRTEDIQIIDSIVVDKSKFLTAYKLSPDGGSLISANIFFKTAPTYESVVYMNEKGTKIYFGQQTGTMYRLSSMDKLLNGFGNKKYLSENNFGLSGSTNYPYVLTDGVTLYFSGIDDHGIGQYDLYVTRYNLDNDSYLNPEKLNMPFNSLANDYMMVLDETKGIGWFATDRFQPEGKVCVYTYIPNEEVVLLDVEDEKYRERRARITSIRDTWKPGKNYSELIATARKNMPKIIEQAIDFTFVIDDNHTYYTYTDFKSQTALKLFKDLENKNKNLSAIEKELTTKQEQYSTGNSNVKSALSASILNLEKEQEDLQRQIPTLETAIRNDEINIKK